MFQQGLQYLLRIDGGGPGLLLLFENRCILPDRNEPEFQLFIFDFHNKITGSMVPGKDLLKRLKVIVSGYNF